MPKHARKKPCAKKKPKAAPSGHFMTVVQQVLVATGAVGVVYGQAEMLGEPWRHILAVGCVGVLVLAAVWMKKT